MADQILAGGATSLVNLVIHAVLIGALVVFLLSISGRSAAAPRFLNYTVIIVVTGSVLFVGHFVEVMLWAYTYAAWRRAAGHRSSLFRLRQLHDARLWRGPAARALAPAR